MVKSVAILKIKKGKRYKHSHLFYVNAKLFFKCIYIFARNHILILVILKGNLYFNYFQMDPRCVKIYEKHTRIDSYKMLIFITILFKFTARSIFNLTWQ